MKKLSIISIFILSMFLSTNAIAQNVENIGEFDDWMAYSFKEKSGKVCYIASSPKKDDGNYTSRGDIFAIVTHRPGLASYDVLHIIAGYTYKSQSPVKVRIGTQDFELYTKDNSAWAQNSETDTKVVNAMRKGVRMVVHGSSSRGTKTTDTYSLKGFSNAYNAISSACGKK